MLFGLVFIAIIVVLEIGGGYLFRRREPCD